MTQWIQNLPGVVVGAAAVLIGTWFTRKSAREHTEQLAESATEAAEAARDAASEASEAAYQVSQTAARVATQIAERDVLWRHREETMRQLRWATELMLSEDEWSSYAGVSALDSLLESQLLQEVDRNLVRAMILVAEQMEGTE